MEQRRLRLGDILDDYCPRERRVTNHAVVAMVEEDVKQTRCTTCDAEHVYKGGQAPRRKRAETTGKLYKQVLAGITDQETAVSSAEPDTMDDPEHDHAEPIEAVAEVIETAPIAQDEESELDPEAGLEPAEREDDDGGPVHRPLIRAQLPRVEGVKLERQAPDFTIRQNNGRANGHFRGGDLRARGGQGPNNGQRFGRGPHRGGGGGGGGRGGAGQGFGRGPGGGNQPRPGGGGRKRGR
jgi:hypothetical protein